MVSIYLLTFPDATTKLIGILTLVGQFAGFLFEIPSGYISDRIGHKNAMVLSRAALLASTICYVFANSIVWFFLATIFMSIGWAFASGTGRALMFETIRSLGREKEYSRIMGKLRSIGFFIPIAFILGIPVIAESFGYQAAFSSMVILDLIGLLATWAMCQPQGESHAEIEELSSDTSGWRSILNEYLGAGWLPYVIPTVIILSLSLGATMGFKNTYQELLGFSLSFIGVLWALSRFIISGVLLLNQRIYDALSYAQFVLLRTSGWAIILLLLGILSNKWAIAALFILASLFLHGFRSANNQYELEFIKDSSNKATLISISALFSQVFVGLAGLAMGFLVFNLDYQNAFLVMGIIGVLVVIGSWVFGLRKVGR